jgi:hypothetical protein
LKRPRVERRNKWFRSLKTTNFRYTIFRIPSIFLPSRKLSRRKYRSCDYLSPSSNRSSPRLLSEIASLGVDSSLENTSRGCVGYEKGMSGLSGPIVYIISWEVLMRAISLSTAPLYFLLMEHCVWRYEHYSFGF